MNREIENRIHQLEQELKQLRLELASTSDSPTTVYVNDEMSGLFGAMEKKIREYFADMEVDPESGEITVQGQRYVLFRSDSLSHEFSDFVKERYSDRSEEEAVSIANNFLYDNAKVIGKKDALAFHKNLKLKEPIDKLSAGPIHFAFTGWANVEIFDESNPTPDENFLLKYQHHHSFEAQSWLKAGKKSKNPVCTMNSGYSAGWCEESFGMSLTAVEVTCEAKGDTACTFIMAPTNKIEDYVGELSSGSELKKVEVPVFFQRQRIEKELRDSLEQKELLIKEIHHRVKNNLQVINSLLRLQMEEIEDEELKGEFEASINRVNTMAVVHELMYQRKDFDRVNLNTYFKELTKSLVNLYCLSADIKVVVKIEVPKVEFDLGKSIPLALMLNEIICNAFKHGLKKGGKFYLDLSEENGRYTLIVGDTGPGIGTGKGANGLGLALIDILSDQIDATKEIKDSNNGLEYKITFEL